MDRIRNEEVRRRAGIGRELVSRVDRRVSRWFGHVERMDEKRLASRMMTAEVSGGRRSLVYGLRGVWWIIVRA